MIQDSGSEATFRACPLKPPSSRWTVLSDRSLRRTPLLPSLFAYRKYFKAKSAKLQGVSGKFMILLLQFSHAADLYMKNVTVQYPHSYKSTIFIHIIHAFFFYRKIWVKSWSPSCAETISTRPLSYMLLRMVNVLPDHILASWP